MFVFKGTLSESELAVIKLDMVRNNTEEAPESSERSSTVDFEVNTLMKGVVFRFEDGLSNIVLKNIIRRPGQAIRVDENGKPQLPAAYFVWVNADGKARKYFLSCARKTVVEVEAPKMQGQLVVPTGNTYVANHENFKTEGAVTDFQRALMLFPNDKSTFEALAANNVEVVVKDRVTVRAASFSDRTRAVNQSVMIMDFKAEGAEREALVKKLDEAATAAREAAAKAAQSK